MIVTRIGIEQARAEARGPPNIAGIPRALTACRGMGRIPKTPYLYDAFRPTAKPIVKQFSAWRIS
jgi:hypothetical protein